MKQWYCIKNEKKLGPFTKEEMDSFLQKGQVSSATKVWKLGMTEWEKIGNYFPQIEGRSPEEEPPAIPLTPKKSTPDEIKKKAEKKITAGLCGIFLGGLGVHKFVLGYQTAGIITLLISFGPCFLGFLAMVPIGTIEGIIYLTKSDEDFVATYIDGKKEWF